MPRVIVPCHLPSIWRMSVIGTGGGGAADAQPASTTAASTISTATLIDRDTAICPTLAFPVALMSLPSRRPTKIQPAGPVRRAERDTGPPDVPIAPDLSGDGDRERG